MPKLFLAFLLMLGIVQRSSAQSNFILAGQLSGMSFTDYVPDLRTTWTYNSPPTPPSSSLVIDFDNDGNYDFALGSGGWTTLAGSGSSISIRTYHGWEIYCKLDTNFSSPYHGNYGFCDTLHHLVVRKYFLNDALYSTSDSLWRSQGYTWQSSDIAGQYCSLTDHNPRSDSVYYYFLRLVSNGDTLLGYVHIEGTVVFDYAIQGPQSIRVVSSIKDVVEDPDLKIYPVPFSDQLNISSVLPYNYILSDITGKVINSGSSKTIDTKILPPGVYILTLKNNNSSFSRRVIKLQNN